MANTRVLIVDDNNEIRRSLSEYLSAQEDMEVVGQARNGVEALRFLEEHPVDIMLLDIIMPQLDGYGVLEQMQKNTSASHPQVIVLTALGRDDFIMRAVSLGVQYYMVKPVELGTLLGRIRDLAGGGTESIQTSIPRGAVIGTPARNLDDRLSNIFLTLGIPAHIKGYQFLREAVKQVIDKPELINSITKELYPAIAKRFNTSSSKVERAIRHAIEVAWSRGRVETLNKAFGCRVALPDEKPTNGEFIAMIADKLSLERNAS